MRVVDCEILAFLVLFGKALLQNDLILLFFNIPGIQWVFKPCIGQDAKYFSTRRVGMIAREVNDTCFALRALQRRCKKRLPKRSAINRTYVSVYSEALGDVSLFAGINLAPYFMKIFWQGCSSLQYQQTSWWS